MLKVECGQAWEEEAGTAATQLLGQVEGSQEASLGLLFSSAHYDAQRLIGDVQSGLPNVPVFGCTTAGEIGRVGFSTGSAVLMTLTSDKLRIGAGLGRELTDRALVCGRDAAARAIGAVDEPTVVMTMIDGRTNQEERFIAGVSTAAAGLPVIGGSASDDLGTEPRARVFAQGQAFSDCGLVLAVETQLPLSVLVCEHHRPLETRVVVTEADPSQRLIHELNGRPAAEVFARLYDLDRRPDSAVAARHPFAQVVDGRPYMRSVMNVEGESLRLACAVENGMILRPTRSRGLLPCTEAALARAREAVGGTAALIAFHCLGRYLEARALGREEELGALLAADPVIGFNTFGEQVNALHVNNTLAALAFGDG